MISPSQPAASLEQVVNTEIPIPDGATAESRLRKTTKQIIQILLTVGLLVLLFRQIPWSNVWKVVDSLDARLLIWACVWWFPTQYLQFAKWRMLARKAGENVSRGDIRRGYWVGFTLGVVTPGRVGQFGRALALHNCSLSQAVGLTVTERAYTALTINSLGLLSLVALPLLGWIPPFSFYGPITYVLLLLAGFGLLTIGVFPRLAYMPLSRLVRHLPLRDKLEKALSVIHSMPPTRGILLIFLSAASTATSLFQFVLIIRASGANIPVFAGMLAGLLTFFIKGALPISLGSLGIGEWTAVYCFSGLGVEPSVAVASSLVLFTINVFVPSLIGLPFVQSLRTPEWPKRKAIENT